MLVNNTASPGSRVIPPKVVCDLSDRLRACGNNAVICRKGAISRMVVHATESSKLTGQRSIFHNTADRHLQRARHLGRVDAFTPDAQTGW